MMDYRVQNGPLHVQQHSPNTGLQCQCSNTGPPLISLEPHGGLDMAARLVFLRHLCRAPLMMPRPVDLLTCVSQDNVVTSSYKSLLQDTRKSSPLLGKQVRRVEIMMTI